MVILVDAYNLLHVIFDDFARSDGKKARSWLITMLARYARAKRDTVSEIRIAFDAGPFRHRYREVKSGVVVVYSGTASTADEVIIAWAHEERGRAVVVSHDRRVQDQSCEAGARVVDGEAFWMVVREVLERDNQTVSYDSYDVVHYENDDDSNELPDDIVLMMCSGRVEHKPEDVSDDCSRDARRGKKGKHERAAERLIDKLR
jgi:predicted RNA-binding protein with PIN domain